jgi:hypothetical protein
VFTLNEPDINGISASEAASWYIQYINPLVSYRITFLLRATTYLILGDQEGSPCRYFQHDYWRRP